jgi:hypothetical protein
MAEPRIQIGSSQHSPRLAACKLSRSAASSAVRGYPGLLFMAQVHRTLLLT